MSDFLGNPIFRFSFRPNDTQWYYWNDGLLDTSDTAKYISAPQEWEKTARSWVRSFELRGYTRRASAAYQFVLDGAAILRSVYIAGSIKSKVYFLIEKLNVGTVEYEDFFAGEIDLSTYLDGVIYNDGPRALAAGVIEGGITAKLEANENTPYQIEITPDAYPVNMDGIKVQVNYTWGTVGTAVSGGHNITAGGPWNDRGLQLYFVLKEGEYSGNGTPADQVDMLMKNATFAVSTAEYNNELYHANSLQDVAITINSHHFFYTNPSGPANVKMRVSVIHWDDSAGSASRTAQIVDPSPCALFNSKPWDTGVTTFHRTLDTNDRLYITYDLIDAATGNPPTTGSYGFDYDALGDAINLGVAFRLPTTVCDSLPYIYVVNNIAEQITGISNVVESDFFSNSSLVTYDCHPANVKLTCGDALRRLTTNPAGVATIPSIRTTWGEIKKDMINRFGVGIDVRNGKIVIEEAGSFFDESQVIAHLGEVKTFTYEPAKEYFCTSQKWGYNTTNYGELNGRDDPHTTQYWKWPIDRPVKDDDRICPFTTSMYQIEAARANLANKKTIDSQSDNETFCIETEATTTGGKYDLFRPQNDYTQPSVTGLLFPETAYGLTMTGNRNLRRSGKFIRMALYNLDTETLAFQTTDKNAELNINLGSGAIAEKASILVSTLDPAFAIPVFFHVEAITPIAMKSNMDNVPDGCFLFFSKGIEYGGFPIEVGTDGESQDTYQMTLLCTPLTDITPLIGM